MLSPAGEIRTWNAGATRVFGYTAEQAIGRHLTLFYGDDGPAKTTWELTTADREGRVEDEGWRIRADGTRFWANTVITALRGSAGELRGFAKVTRDLTERKKAEEKLRQSEEIFRLLIGSVQEYAIFMLDPGGHIATWNAGARRIKQYEAREIIGRHFSVFYPKEDVEARKPELELEIAIRDGSVEDEGWRIRKDGSRFWANVVITAVRNEAGELRGFAKVTRDITDRKYAEEMQTALVEQREARLAAEQERQRVEVSYRIAQEANRSKDEFLMTLSHELRTPITSILGWARLLPTMESGDATFHEAIQSISRSAQHQARLIDDVLDMSRVVSGKLRLAIETVDILPILTTAVDAVRPAAIAKRIDLRTDLPESLGRIAVDPTRLQQIIWNLLSNAVKFTPRDGFIELSARRTSSHVQIAVKDSGEGIDPKFLPHVFEPFRQAEGSTTRVHGGLGLGLSIVRYLVEGHGGSVSAESEGKGKGSTFTVTFPVHAMTSSEQVRNAATVEAPGEAVPPLRRLDGIRVVTVDDDPESRAMIAAVLRQAGATVSTAESAAEAWGKITALAPDIIVTDIAMPEVDGFAFARELRENAPTSKTTLVALTAFSTSIAAEDFDEVLIKPVDPYAFADALADLHAEKKGGKD